MALKKTQDNRLEAFKVKAAGKVPPHNIEAEQSMLGSVLLNRSEFDGVKAKVSARDFYEPRHRLIFSAMEQLWEDNRAIDSLTVIEVLNTRAQLEESGPAGRARHACGRSLTAGPGRVFARQARERLVDLAGQLGAFAEIGGRGNRDHGDGDGDTGGDPQPRPQAHGADSPSRSA